MEQTFISEIKINQSRNITNLTVPLSENERKHLILTGKNGSGKTSLLQELNNVLHAVENNTFLPLKLELLKTEIYKHSHQSAGMFRGIQNTFAMQIENLEEEFENQPCVVYFRGIEELANKYKEGLFVTAFFGAQRHLSLNAPSGISKVNLKTRYKSTDTVSREFLQYIVNLRADRSFARDDNEIAVVRRIDNWFNNFEKRLRDIFESPTLTLKFDRKNYDFKILEENKLPYSFTTLSHGYSAIINIVSELLLRMEWKKSKAYDAEGVVLIDEIETHLHVELQKKILPFLTDFFPNIQFIVTTHSPFIISSIPNAVVCDLEKKIIIDEDLTGYSYDTLIETYFDSDNYSNVVKSRLSEYEDLMNAGSLSDDNKLKLIRLEKYFNEIPKFLADEIALKLNQIKLNNLDKRHIK